MTRQEFQSGWLLLIVQPWGWRYNQVRPDGTPTVDAVTQFDFYFQKLAWAHPEAWRKVAGKYAEGKEWPSIQDLRVALQHVNSDYVRALPRPSADQSYECPAEVVAILDRYRGRSMPTGD